MPNMHYLGGNKVERSPAHLLVIDTETRSESSPRGELHRLRLWRARTVRRHGYQPKRPHHEDFGGTTAEGIVDLVEQLVTTKHPMWVYAHNLSFELAVTRLPLRLVERGWELRRNCLASDQPWCNLARGGHSVWLLDSWSILPNSVEELGRKLGIPKPTLPSDLDSDEAWWARCSADVDITATALEQLLDWWDEHELGCFSKTGPATGWNAMRHMCITAEKPGQLRVDGDAEFSDRGRTMHKVLICDDPEIRAFERRAIYQGYRDLGRVGRWPMGTYLEFDLRQAHLRIAASTPLPRKYVRSYDSLPLDSVHLRARNAGLIAEVEVQTTEPRYPLRAGGKIIYPTGRFWTTLAGPEVHEAHRRGELLQVGRTQLYKTGWLMRPWALWAQAIIQGEDPSAPPAARVAVKGWSRSVIGKWASHSSRVEDMGEIPDQGWELIPAPAARRAEVPSLLRFGGRLLAVHQDQESDNAFPAVLATIQSWCRLQLLQLLDTVGRDALVQCNTDGAIFDAVAAGMRMEALPAEGPIPALRWEEAERHAAVLSGALEGAEVAVKGIYRAVEVLTPQHLQADGTRRMAGVPASAKMVEPNRFKFLAWPKLASQLRYGVKDGYLRPQLTRDLSAAQVQAWVYEDGCVAPLAVVSGPDRVPMVLEPSQVACQRHGAPLRLQQAAWLPKPGDTLWREVLGTS